MNQKMLDKAIKHINNLTPEEFAQGCERLSGRTKPPPLERGFQRYNPPQEGFFGYREPIFMAK